MPYRNSKLTQLLQVPPDSPAPASFPPGPSSRRDVRQRPAGAAWSQLCHWRSDREESRVGGGGRRP